MLKKMNAGQIIAGIYIVLIFTLFPLLFRDYYYDILPVKYYFYCGCAAFIILFSTGYCIYKWKKKDSEWYGIKKRLMNISIPEFFLLSFTVINIISTIISAYQYESFWGNEGRYNGLFIWLLYTVSFFSVIKIFTLKKWYLDVFLGAGMLVCLLGISDYFQLNLLGFKTHLYPGQYNMFTSTIGNVNTYTSYVALLMGVGGILFCTSKSFGKAIWYYICTIVTFFAILMGLSDNAYLALGALFGLSPLYLFRYRTGIKRYILMVASFAGVIWCVDFINKIMPEKVLYMSGLLRTISGLNYLEVAVILVFVFCGFVYLLSYFNRNKEDDLGKRYVYIWSALIGTVALVLLYMIYDANWGGNAAKYAGFSNYLLFDDEWGTHRGYNWRIGLEMYRDFPLRYKLFGYGPDTYGILCVTGKYHGEMIARYDEIFDNIHNEYLQLLVTVGPLGLMSYLGFLLSSFRRMVKKGFHNNYVMAAMIAVVCYAVQAIVNINVPIVMPMVMALLASGLAGCEDSLLMES